MRSQLKRLAKYLLTPKGNKTVKIVDISLTFDRRDHGGIHYEGRSSITDRRNQLYEQLRSTLRPEVIVDVGANYGFTAAIFAKEFPNAELVIVEPDPRLVPFIRKNLTQNGVKNFELIEAVCGNEDGTFVNFGINPLHSQDNRVTGLKGWKSVKVPCVTLNSILKHHFQKRVFLKVDTQGFEHQVIKGAEDFLKKTNHWIIKSEFAPHWLKSQGTSPEELLLYLIRNYRVVEAPSQTRFCRDELPDLFTSPITENEVPPFTQYIESLNRNNKGWVDIYIAPRSGFLTPD